MSRMESRIGGCFTALLFVAFALGASGAWHGEDALLKANIPVGGIAWLLLFYAQRKASWMHWRGTLQFAACWLIFLLFKGIAQFWISSFHDGLLLAVDRALWGGLSLPEHALALETPWLSEVVSLGYLAFYFVVLLPVIWFSWRRKSSEAHVFFLGLSAMYLVGYTSYLLVPASGPFAAFPDIFPYPVRGGAISALLVNIVTEGITGMDVFPSLHVGITLYVLGFFALGTVRGYRIVAALLTLIFVPLTLATIYLRYHYGVDLIAGTALACCVLVMVRKERRLYSNRLSNRFSTGDLP